MGVSPYINMCLHTEICNLICTHIIINRIHRIHIYKETLKSYTGLNFLNVSDFVKIRIQKGNIGYITQPLNAHLDTEVVKHRTDLAHLKGQFLCP